MLVCMIPAVSLTSFAEEKPTIEPDISWYTYSPSENKTFYLYDAADLLGLAQIMSVNSTTIDSTQVKSSADRFNSSGSYKHTFVLMNDIDLNPGWDASSDEAPANAWPTFGVAFNFQGVIDGNGHTIKGIYFDNSYNGLGILGQINGRSAEIKDLTIENSYYKSNNGNAGFLFGYVKASPTLLSFSNVYVEATIEQTTAAGYMGGFIGFNDSTNNGTANIKIENCVFDGNIDAMYTGSGNCGIGGFIAGNNSASTTISIKNSASYMNVTCSAATDERVFVGGLVGLNLNAAIELSNCVGSVDSTVTGNKVCVGALAGGSRYADTAAAKYNFTGECYYTGDTPVGCTFKNASPYTYVTSGDDYNTSATNVATNAKKPANNQTLSDAVSGWTGWSANGNKPMPTEVLNMLTTPVAEIVGYQATDAEDDGKFNFRIVGVLNVEEEDLANTILSISATATYTLDGEKTLTLENYPINTVYTSIDGNSDTGLVTYTAKELGGNYIFVLPCKNVPANATDIKVEIIVTYAVNDGNGTATRTLYVEAPKDAVN